MMWEKWTEVVGQAGTCQTTMQNAGLCRIGKVVREVGGVILAR